MASISISSVMQVFRRKEIGWFLSNLPMYTFVFKESRQITDDGFVKITKNKFQKTQIGKMNRLIAC